MRRIVMWFLSTVTAIVLLFGYHTSTSGPTSSDSAVVSSSGDGTSGSPTQSGSDATSGTTSGSASTGKTVTGDSVDTRWGPVQVEITVAGGAITAVDVPVYPDSNPKDQEINSYAVPTLIQETLDSQSGDIDMISGATVTSDGYLQSLQSALDEAGL
jgi:uncharacterized protein with FMN-binding domain